MDYEGLDSSGTDDDLHPSHHNRISRQGRSSGNGRSFVGSVPYPRTHIDMETQIHNLEQEAYCAVLRAFKAQADAITWEKESLITELRKELRVSDDEHRELLSQVNSEDVIRRIREWRQGGGQQAAMYGSSQHMHEVLPSPTVSGSRKKPRTSQPQHLPGSSAARLTQYPPSVPAFSRQYSHRSSSGLVAPNSAAEADSLIGRKVWTRWPEDNSFYEATITDYNPIEGRHALVYAMHTPEESWEWVDLKEISPEDIRWDGEDLGISRRGHIGTVQGFGRSFVRSGPGRGSGRGRGFARGQTRKEYLPSQNGVAKKLLDDIEISNTEKLVKEVERIFDASHLDPAELAKTKKMLKDHEQALADALARLGDASDGESDGEQALAEGQLMDLR